MKSEAGVASGAPAIFDGVPAGDLEEALERGERRSFAAGEVVIAEGDTPDQVFVITAGSAEVTVSDRDGVEHHVGRVGHGMTVGEMSLVTGEPAAATVRAEAGLELIALSGREFERLASRFPLVYRNVGTMLAQRLAKTNRLVAASRTGQVIELKEAGGPPELPWALACSLAWHTRTPTLLLVLGSDPPELLRSLAERHGAPSQSSATVRLIPSLAAARNGSLGSELEYLRSVYDHILFLGRERDGTPLPTRSRLLLTSDDDDAAADAGPDRVVRAWCSSVPETLGPGADGAIRIGPLAAAETGSLREGRLATGASAGRSIGWLARDLAGLKVGLALGAGSIRGYAHIGVIEALERLGVEPDYLAGTSVGSALAGLYADGRNPAEMADELDHCGRVLFRPTLSRRGFLSNRALRRYLESTGPETYFTDLKRELAIVTADLEQQQEVVIREGLVWMAVLASISIPGVFPAVQMQGRTLVDGGILNPVPTSAVADMGAGAVIGVRLSTPAGAPTREVVARDQSNSSNSALSTILRSLDIMQARIGIDLPDTPLVALAPEFPELPGAKLRHFSMGRRYIEEGAAATEAALQRISTIMPWLRPLPSA